MSTNTICKAITSRGTICKARALEGQEWCFNHSPHSAEQRRKHASLGGKSRSRKPTEVGKVEKIDRDLANVAKDVRDGKITEDQARVIVQALNGRLRAEKVRQDTLHFVELEDRIARLEKQARTAQHLNRGSRRGA